MAVFVEKIEAHPQGGAFVPTKLALVRITGQDDPLLNDATLAITQGYGQRIALSQSHVIRTTWANKMQTFAVRLMKQIKTDNLTLENASFFREKMKAKYSWICKHRELVTKAFSSYLISDCKDVGSEVQLIIDAHTTSKHRSDDDLKKAWLVILQKTGFHGIKTKLGGQRGPGNFRLPPTVAPMFDVILNLCNRLDGIKMWRDYFSTVSFSTAQSVVQTDLRHLEILWLGKFLMPVLNTVISLHTRSVVAHWKAKVPSSRHSAHEKLDVIYRHLCTMDVMKCVREFGMNPVFKGEAPKQYAKSWVNKAVKVGGLMYTMTSLLEVILVNYAVWLKEQCKPMLVQGPHNQAAWESMMASNDIGRQIAGITVPSVTNLRDGIIKEDFDSYRIPAASCFVYCRKILKRQLHISVITEDESRELEGGKKKQLGYTGVNNSMGQGDFHKYRRFLTVSVNKRAVAKALGVATDPLHNLAEQFQERYFKPANGSDEDDDGDEEEDDSVTRKKLERRAKRVARKKEWADQDRLNLMQESTSGEDSDRSHTKPPAATGFVRAFILNEDTNPDLAVEEPDADKEADNDEPAEETTASAAPEEASKYKKSGLQEISLVILC